MTTLTEKFQSVLDAIASIVPADNSNAFVSLSNKLDTIIQQNEVLLSILGSFSSCGSAMSIADALCKISTNTSITGGAQSTGGLIDKIAGVLGVVGAGNGDIVLPVCTGYSSTTQARLTNWLNMPVNTYHWILDTTGVSIPGVYGSVVEKTVQSQNGPVYYSYQTLVNTMEPLSVCVSGFFPDVQTTGVGVYAVSDEAILSSVQTISTLGATGYASATFTMQPGVDYVIECNMSTADMPTSIIGVTAQ